MPEASVETALDFVNTLEHSRDGDTEHLPDEPALRAWLAAHDLLGEDPASHAGARHAAGSLARSMGRLDAARELRKALRGLVDARVAGRAPVRRELEVVNGWLRRRGRLRLVPDEHGLALVPDEVGDAVERALARLAEAGARGVTEGDLSRLKVCANDECRWAFHDTSRAGRRKWCDMASCGNRAKARRHRERLTAEGEGRA